MQNKIWLLAFLLTLFTSCANDQIITSNNEIMVVDGDDAEIAQIETLITPVELVENDDGSMRYRVRASGKYLFLEGTINTNFPIMLYSIFDQNPNIEWVVLTSVLGSMDDEANLEGSTYLRNQGVKTYIPKGGTVASGGTDLFLAGTKRVIINDTQSTPSIPSIGVHSWASGDGTEGKYVPKDDPEHSLYLNYYKEMDIPESFYWFTLEVADAENIHNMTLAEIELYKLTTKIIMQ